MKRAKPVLYSAAAAAVVAMSLAAPIEAYAQDGNHGSEGTIVAADPDEKGTGTMGPAAAAARRHGPLPFGPAAVAQKAAANRAYDAAARSGALRPASAAELEAAGHSPSRTAPTIVGGLNFAGVRGGTANTNSAPPDNEGAIGLTRYIQTINTAVRIFNRSNGAVIATGSLNQLAHNAGSVDSFDPQIIWDPTTNRFYYTMDSIFSATDNRLAFGFSKNASPTNVTTDWCHYYFKYGTPFPDYPKLGDSRFFMIIGVNVFANNSTGGFSGSDIVAISKPANGNITTCPAASSFKRGKKANLKDTGGTQVFTPVPANQIDTIGTGYVVAVDGHVPANKLWFFSVTRNATTGAPVFGNARGVSVPSYSPPPAARQPTFTQVIDTLDGRNTQAIQAINPSHTGTVFSFWTQHTIASGSVSAVRWYEINPVPAKPVVLRSETIAATNTFIFNAAISPDRKVRGGARAFGDSMVIQYNASSSVNSIAPRILAKSSLHGGAVSGARLIKNGADGYRDFTCPNPGDTCRWGDYAAATPDPAPTTNGVGEVWGTNQYSGVKNPPANGVNWRTQIFALQP